MCHVRNQLIVFHKPEFDLCVDDADWEEVEPGGGVIRAEQQQPFSGVRSKFYLYDELPVRAPQYGKRDKAISGEAWKLDNQIW